MVETPQKFHKTLIELNKYNRSWLIDNMISDKSLIDKIAQVFVSLVKIYSFINKKGDQKSACYIDKALVNYSDPV